MKICDHVTEKCFEPTDSWKEPCPHAVGHDTTIECAGTQCQRFGVLDDNSVLKRESLIWMKHVEI